MNKIVYLILLVGGLLLMLVGLVSDSASDSELFRAAPDSVAGISTWLLLAGGTAAASGMIGLWFAFRGYSQAFRKVADTMR